MARMRLSRFQCGHPDCREVVQYEYANRTEAASLFQRYGQGRWLCVRHSQPDEVLSPTNLIRVGEQVSREEPYGRYWGHSGFVFGPGFKAFAKDFPPGTKLRVTAEIILPEEAPADG